MSSDPGRAPVVRAVENISLLKRPVKVLITGAEGAGKTKLTLLWESDARGTSPSTIRSPAAEDRGLRIQGARERWWRRRPKKFVTLIVPPGQIANESRKEVFDTYTVSGRRPDGVIHVVCWGYNKPWRGEDAVDVRNAVAQAWTKATQLQREAEHAFMEARLAKAEAPRVRSEPRHARDEWRKRSLSRRTRIAATPSTKHGIRGRVPAESSVAMDEASIDEAGGRRVHPRRRYAAQRRQSQAATGVSGQSGMTVEVRPEDVIENLRTINLEKELDDFRIVSRVLTRAWAQRSRAAGERFWLVIALAKCDLYDAEVARRYYAPVGADETTEFGRILADLKADVPTLKVVVCPVSSFPEPYGEELNLGGQVDPILRPDDALTTLNQFWAIVEGLCGIS